MAQVKRASHAVQRCRQRLGAGRDAARIVAELARAGRSCRARVLASFVYADGRPALRLEHKVDGRPIRYAFDPGTGMVITVLPPRPPRDGDDRA